MKRVLMVAFHFPPMAGSSGIQRTLRFARYLPDFGWEPVVLTANPRAYEQVSDDQLVDIPAHVEVIRAPAWDTARHLSFGGRYPAIMARPDRWISWWLGAHWSGLRAIRRHKPHAIWSTYPIATAHLVGGSLARISKLPWVADFRDPMAQDGYPVDPAIWRSFSEIEQRAVGNAQFSTFVTPSAVEMYRARYPQVADRISLLENGYDEETFAGMSAGEPLNDGRLTLLHSGVVYPSERDPSELFGALKRLKLSRPVVFARLKVRFRAAQHTQLLNQLAERFDVANAIEIMPPVGYRDALREMMRADGLLILQAANCNQQIPAKLYEYMRAGRPIVVLTDSRGDTASAARAAGIEAIASLEDASAIADLLERFVEQSKSGTLPSSIAVAAASRRERTRQLASLLSDAVSR